MDGRSIVAAVTIRSAKPVDAPTLHELHTASVRTLCAPHYDPHVIDGWLSNRTPAGYLPVIDAGRVIVAIVEDEIAGFGEAIPGEIRAIYVRPAYARRGVGSALLRRCLDMARPDQPGSIRLEATLNAVSFYERHGFSQIERITLPRNAVEIPVVVMEWSGGGPTNRNETSIQ